MNRRIKQRFDAGKIEIASSSQPIYLDVSPELRSQLKQAIREVLKEAAEG